jgi:hypothetical protein
VPSIFPTFIKRLAWIAVPVVAVSAALLSYAIERLGQPPRALSPYIERRTSGHNPVIVRVGNWMARTLMALDRGEYRPTMPPPLRIGAQPEMPSPSGAASPRGRVLLVASTGEAIKAIAQAGPGDTITFLPGTYRFGGGSIPVNRSGAENNGITVRADRPETVFLEFAMIEGFLVSAPYWKFENLNIRGTCQQHSDCEHAFHVVGKGAYFTARNNTITDFNAHFKINALGANAPDHGLIDGNTLSNSSVRDTGNPVTVIDLVAASHWVVRGNLISDFVKGQSSRVSYGAFAKGGGSDNRFERNIVLCESRLRGAPGQRVGLSLGDGGTGKPFCRDQRCITEQENSVIQSNLIAFCSDDGIYINRAATSKIFHNTLIDTGGIVVRFVESSADVQGNLVDGSIRSRDGGLLRASGNYETSMTRLYLGLHPVRSMYVNPGTLDLAWRSQAIPRASGVAAPDLCAASRPLAPAYGAFENFSSCLR